MKSTSAEAVWPELDAVEEDRAPGAPLLGFLSGTVISIGLWVMIVLIALSMKL